jgi:hypothetical protein
MISHEFGMLVLNAPLTKADQNAVNSFVQEQIIAERKRILAELENYQSGGTLSIALFKLRQIVTKTKEQY